MPKQKTHKGMKKRFRVTASGKVKHRKTDRGHLKSGKSPKRKRLARVDGVYGGVRAAMVIEGLRPSL
jgi:large subunit ribosomal protein L35